MRHRPRKPLRARRWVDGQDVWGVRSTGIDVTYPLRAPGPRPLCASGSNRGRFAYRGCRCDRPISPPRAGLRGLHRTSLTQRSPTGLATGTGRMGGREAHRTPQTAQLFVEIVKFGGVFCADPRHLPANGRTT